MMQDIEDDEVIRIMEEANDRHISRIRSLGLNQEQFDQINEKYMARYPIDYHCD